MAKKYIKLFILLDKKIVGNGFVLDWYIHEYLGRYKLQNVELSEEITKI